MYVFSYFLVVDPVECTDAVSQWNRENVSLPFFDDGNVDFKVSRLAILYSYAYSICSLICSYVYS